MEKQPISTQLSPDTNQFLMGVIRKTFEERRYDSDAERMIRVAKELGFRYLAGELEYALELETFTI